MDRNSIIGIILITLLTVVYFQFLAPKPPPPEESQAVATTEQPESNIEDTTDGTQASAEADPATSDSLQQIALQDKFSDFSTVASGQDQTITVKTDELTVNLSTLGGHIESAYLNHYDTYDSLQLPIVADDERNAFYFEFPYNNRAIQTSDLYFTPSSEGLEVLGEDSAQLVMLADLGNGKQVSQTYTFYGNRFDVGYDIEMTGLKDGLGNVSFYSLQWTSYLPKTELSIKNMRQKSTIVYRLGDDIDKLSTTDDLEKEKLTSLVNWVSFKSQFFSHILIADKPLRSGNVTMNTPKNDEAINRIMDSKLMIDIDNGNQIQNGFSFYMGPNEYATLKSYDLELEEQMDLGWWIIGWINKGTTYVFKFLERYIDSYGIIIILLGFLIRLLLLPLSFKSYISMAKMRVLNQTPEIKALDEKYKDDPQKLQMAKMGIYREMGASMFSGCIPTIFSMPFLYAL
ncbi:MAG: membrane protein insertase YidC, partial [Bacteroidota bacterium]